MPQPRPPKLTDVAGRRLWKSITAEYDLEEHELVILRRACAIADVCERLETVVYRVGPLVKSRLGSMIPNPAAVELRNQSQVLVRLLVALRVPLGEQQDERPAGQVRAIRGVYGGG
jgi:hypothetical protein